MTSMDLKWWKEKATIKNLTNDRKYHAFGAHRITPLCGGLVTVLSREGVMSKNPPGKERCRKCKKEIVKLVTNIVRGNMIPTTSFEAWDDLG